MKRWHAIVLVVGAIALLGGPGRGQGHAGTAERVADAPGCPRSGEFPEPAAIDVTRMAILCLHNAERAKHGLGALVRNPLLELAAQRHADDMAIRNYFAHDTPEGLAPQQRIMSAGYRREWTGENLYFGTEFEATPVRAVRGWMTSPGHRANILRPQFIEVGIGVGYGSPRAKTDKRKSAIYSANFGG